jgi:hypothetical protein
MTIINSWVLHFVKSNYLCLASRNRGALKKRAEIKPIEPDPGNAGEGNGTGFKRRYFPLLTSES